MGQAKVIFVNDTQDEVYLCHGQGVSTTMKPGEKKEFTCTGGKVYRGTPRPNSSQHDSTKKLVLDLNGQGCGNTIKASSAY
jgi:ribosomal protein L44E